MRATVCRALSTFGGSCASQRWQASALLAMAASVWFTSCAMEVVSSPTVDARATRSNRPWASCTAALAASMFRAR
ncbi:hypothetical protein G6F23_015539 [Rhizopus arrhizus]|nr:hypothetical protein G6F23_015539 [Rhizopus arrhizus]